MFSSSRRALPLLAAFVAAAAGSPAHAQWTVTVLEPAIPGTFSRANAVFGTRQGGSRDNGYSIPRQWSNSAASGISLAEPGPDSGSSVKAITATNAFGDGFVRTSEFDGYYAALLWNASGSSVTVFPPPFGFYEVQGNGAGGSQQVGAIRNDTESRPVLWTGTPESLVDLLPAGCVWAVAYATDGLQQVGYADFDSHSVAALWSGAAASFVSLNPPGWLQSTAVAVGAGSQVGWVSDESHSHAALWMGTAASFVDLHPSGTLNSEARGISQGLICGTVTVPGPEWSLDRAAYWSGPSASTYVDLHAALPSWYEVSEARGIWSDGAGAVRIVGSAYNVISGNTEAVMWSTVPVIGACCVGASCSITSSSACAGSHKGAGSACEAATCCGISNFDSPAGDCDGDLTLDACQSPANDCNNNGIDDLCDTLVVTAADFSSGPGAFSFNGDAGLQGSFAVLTPSLPGQGGSIVRPPLTTGVTRQLRAIFDFRISEPSIVPADGFSFALMDAGLYGLDVVFGEDAFVGPNVIAVTFNTFENFPGEGSNSVALHYNGNVVARNTSLPYPLANASWNRAIVELTADGRITVKLASNPGGAATIFSNVQLPGYIPFRANIGFGGRTGGFYARQEITNIRLGVSGSNDANGNGLPDTCDCPADFNLSGALTVQDIFDFLTAFFSSSAAADFNHSGAVSVQDIFDFLAAYFAGC